MTFIRMLVRHWIELLNERSYLNKHAPCKKSGVRNLYCYNCNLDDRCPYDKRR